MLKTDSVSQRSTFNTQPGGIRARRCPLQSSSRTTSLSVLSDVRSLMSDTRNEVPESPASDVGIRHYLLFLNTPNTSKSAMFNVSMRVIPALW